MDETARAHAYHDDCHGDHTGPEDRPVCFVVSKRIALPHLRSKPVFAHTTNAFHQTHHLCFLRDSRTVALCSWSEACLASSSADFPSFSSTWSRAIFSISPAFLDSDMMAEMVVVRQWQATLVEYSLFGPRDRDKTTYYTQLDHPRPLRQPPTCHPYRSPGCCYKRSGSPASALTYSIPFILLRSSADLID